MKTIDVIVSPVGETRIEAMGFVGSSCQDATRALETALGVRQGEQRKAEFYQSQPTTQAQQVNGS